MLFKKDIEPSCTYCRHGRLLGGGQVGCVKKGIVSVNGQCRHFAYDPLARTPSRPLSINKGLYDEDAFKIDIDE